MKQLMIRYLILLVALSGGILSSVRAQVSRDAAIRLLFDQDMYLKIVESYSADTSGLSGESYKYIGVAYYLSDRSDTMAIHFLEKALSKECSNPDMVYYYLGQSCLFAKDYVRAKSYYRHLLQRNPRHAGSYVGLGYCMLGEHKTDQACQMFENAYVIDNKHIGANFNLGIYSDDPKKCRAYLGNVLKSADSTDHYFVRSLYYLALMDMETKAYADADRRLLLAKRLAPEDSDILEGIIQSLYRQERYAAAEPYKKELYRMYADTAMARELKETFFLDEFSYKKYRVVVKESFESGNAMAGAVKLVFNVYNEYGRLLYRVRLEYAAADGSAGGTAPAGLCLYQALDNDTRIRHGGLFAAGYDYGNVKAAVMDILRKKHTAHFSAR